MTVQEISDALAVGGEKISRKVLRALLNKLASRKMLMSKTAAQLSYMISTKGADHVESLM